MCAGDYGPLSHVLCLGSTQSYKNLNVTEKHSITYTLPPEACYDGALFWRKQSMHLHVLVYLSCTFSCTFYVFGRHTMQQLFRCHTKQHSSTTTSTSPEWCVAPARRSARSGSCCPPTPMSCCYRPWTSSASTLCSSFFEDMASSMLLTCA